MSLIKSAFSGFRNVFLDDSSRSIKARKNVIESFLVKGGQLLVNLMLIPLSIKFVSADQFGVWLTISSLITWFNFFDIGLSHGLRNKLVEADLAGREDLKKKYISTSYASLVIIALVLMTVFLVVNPLLNWQSILNNQTVSNPSYRKIVLVLFVFFCFQLILQNINALFYAQHQPSKVFVISFLGQLFCYLILWTLFGKVEGSLMLLAIVLGCVPTVILFFASIYYFGTKFRFYLPSIKHVDFSQARLLFSLGFRFFVINAGVIVLYQSNSFLIAQLFNSAEVTRFNIAYRLFNTIFLAFSIVIMPFWNAFTDAYLKGDLLWISQTREKLYKIILGFAIIGMLLLIFSQKIISIWVGEEVVVPMALCTASFIFILVNMWHSVQVNILNGIGIIKLQLMVVVVSAVLNIFLSVWLARYLGVTAVVVANIIVFLSMGIILSIQVNKLLNKSAKGIWRK